MSDDFFFDPRGVKRDAPFEVIPAGQYIAYIEKVDRKDAEHSMGLKVYFKILSGPYAEKVQSDYFNINHHNPEAQRIGRQIFAHLLDCVGMGTDPLRQYSDIENKNLKIEVDVVPHYKNFGESQNKIRKYYPLSPIDQNLIKDVSQREQYQEIPF